MIRHRPRIVSAEAATSPATSLRPQSRRASPTLSTKWWLHADRDPPGDPRDRTVTVTLVGGNRDTEVTVTGAGVTATTDFTVRRMAFNIDVAAKRTQQRARCPWTHPMKQSSKKERPLRSQEWPRATTRRATTITRKDNARIRGLEASASTLDIDEPGSNRTHTVRLSSKSIGNISVAAAAQGDDELRYNRQCSRCLR